MSTTIITNFPSHAVDPSLKVKKDWCMQFAKAIDSLFNRNLTGITRQNWDEFERLRAYGNGRQDPRQYMNILLGKQENGRQGTVAGNDRGPTAGNEFMRKGYMNVNWEILNVAANFKNTVLGTFEDVDHDIYADGIDEKSSAAREEAKWKLWVEMEFKDFFEKFQQETGVPLDKPEYIPETLQELQMFSDLGGFKLKSEISIEEALRYTMYISEWKETKRKIFEDLFECGVAVVQDIIDPFTKKAQVQYCDVAMSVIPYSKASDYANMPFAGVYKYYTIAEMRCMTKEDGSQLFKDEEIEAMATQACNLYGNPAMMGAMTPDDYGRYGYDNFKIAVLDCEFKSDDYKFTTERTKSDGRKVVYKDEFNRVRNTEKAKTIKTKVLMVYKCKWVVGTEYCWDYGYTNDVPRPTPSQANLSFHAYSMKAGSMIHRMIPLLDSIQLSWLKLQNAKAMAAPKGISIEYGSLLNMSIGNQKLGPLDILKIRNQTGNILYQASTHRSYMPTQNSYRPIQEIDGGIGPQMLEFITLMDNDINMIRQIVGINTAADASKPGNLVGTTELALQATQTTLKPMYSSYITIKERACRNVVLRIQLMVKFNGEYKLEYDQAIGKPITQVLSIGAEVNNAMFGIRIEAKPTEQEKEAIRAVAMESVKSGKNGYIGISMTDYLMIEQFLSQNMLKMARAYLAAKEAEIQKRKEAEAKANVEQQAAAQEQLQIKKNEGDMAVVQADMYKQLAIIKAKKEAEIEVDNNDSANKLKEIALTGEIQAKASLLTTLADNKAKNDLAADQHEYAMEEIAATPTPKAAEK